MKVLKSKFSHAVGCHIQLVENEKAWRNKYALRFHWQGLDHSLDLMKFSDETAGQAKYQHFTLLTPDVISNYFWFVHKRSVLEYLPPHGLSFLKAFKVWRKNEEAFDASQQDTYGMDGYFSSFLGYNHICDEEKELTKEECVELITAICEDYECEPPKLLYRELPEGHPEEKWLKKTKNTSGVYFIESDEVLLCVPDKTTLLHEMAHALDNRAREPWMYQSHGAMFNRIYTQLLAQYAGHDAEIVVSYANQRGLYGPKYVSVDDVMAPINLLSRDPVTETYKCDMG